MSDISYNVPYVPQWKQLCIAALAERNPAKVPERIAVARSAVLDQIEDNFSKSSSNEQSTLRQDLGGRYVVTQSSGCATDSLHACSSGGLQQQQFSISDSATQREFQQEQLQRELHIFGVRHRCHRILFHFGRQSSGRWQRPDHRGHARLE